MVSESRRGLLLSISMAGGESKVARLYETSTKKSRKRKPPKASSGLLEAWAPEPSEEVEPEPKVPDEVQDSPVPSQGDPGQIPQRVNPHRRQVKLRPSQRPKMPMSSRSAWCNR